MKLEYINNHISSRKKLFLQLSIGLGVFVLIHFIKYYFAPVEYQTGEKSSRTWLSYSQFVSFAIIAILIMLPLSISSRIVLKILVDTDENTLKIEYIDRFKFRGTKKEVRLSDTLIQVEEIDTIDEPDSLKFYVLYLTHKDFGTLKVSGQDYSNINEVALLFKELKETASVKNRQQRLWQRKMKA